MEMCKPDAGKVFGVDIAKVDMEQAVDIVGAWVASDATCCRYVVTPNVDHVLMLDSNPAFFSAYKDSSLIVADGWPVVLAAKLLGVNLPGRVPGSELVPRLFDLADRGSRVRQSVFLLGALPGVAEIAAARIEKEWRNVRVSGFYSPPFGFEKNAEECEKIRQMINASGANILVLGLGAPKQELWIQRFAPQLNVKVALCVGATIDFLAGNKRRAPEWMQNVGLEWLHRMASEPKRLVKRYAKGAVVFPLLFFKEWLRRRA